MDEATCENSDVYGHCFGWHSSFTGVLHRSSFVEKMSE